MKKERSVTLIELMLAIILIGAMSIAIGSIGSSLYAMKKKIFDKQGTTIQGHVTVAAVFERVLRAGSLSSNPAFAILDDGNTLQYKKLGTTERIWLDDEQDTINYHDGSSTSVILRDVKTLNFVQDYENRLAVEITLNNGETFRTAVQPRNQFTPMSIIN